MVVIQIILMKGKQVIIEMNGIKAIIYVITCRNSFNSMIRTMLQNIC